MDRLRRPAVRQAGGAALVFLAISLIYWWHIWITGHPSTSMTCGCGDTTQGVWWMEWVPWALSHGHNLLYSNLLFSRSGGVSALANTSALSLSAVFSPVTALFGPVASFNLANLLAPVVSGTTLFVAARHVTGLWPARVAAGALYAFSPFMLRNTVIGHLQLTWAFYPPLVFLLVMDLLVDKSSKPRTIGIALGALTVVQFFIGMEVLAMTAMATVVGLLVALALRPRTRSCWRRLAASSLWGAVVAGVLLAYPFWDFLAGPQHVAGPLYTGPGAPASFIFNAGASVNRPSTPEQIAGYLGANGPRVEFLGLALVLFLLVSAPLWRRRFVGVVLSLSAGLLVLGTVKDVGIWSGLEKLPVFSSIDPWRFTLLIDMAAALLLAASIDGWWRLAKRLSPSGSRWRAAAGVSVLGATVVGVCAPLVATYSLPLTVESPYVPSFFSELSPPTATTVLTIPFSDNIGSTAMFWQAKAGFSYSTIAGWEFVPGADHVHSQQVSPIKGAFPILEALSQEPPSRFPTLDAANVATLRRSLSQWMPLLVTVARNEPGGAAAAGYLAAVTGQLPRYRDEVWYWNLHPMAAWRPSTATAFSRCLPEVPSPDPMATPRCVLGS